MEEKALEEKALEEKLSGPVPEPDWAAFVAIDWADQKHFWRMAVAGSTKQEQGELENTPEAVEVWAMELHQRFGGRAIAVCLEQSRGALVCLLSKYPHLVLFPVHPKTAAGYRETFAPSGAKSDPSDTASLLDLLLRHRERLRPLKPDTEQTRLLQSLVEGRRRLVYEKTRQTNRLTALLKIYFPQVLKWFDDVDSPLVLGLLESWGSLTELRRAHPGTLRKFFHEHNCRNEERIQERITAIQQALPATEDRAILEGEGRKARAAVALLQTLRSQIEEFDQAIEKVVRVHPETPIFSSLPGAGPVLTSRLVAAFGTQRERYESAYQLQCFSGVAPLTERSGQSQWVHFRWACPKFLRQTFQEFAGHSIAKSTWARAFYDSQRADHKTHHMAVRALACRWIPILFRCWKDQKPYDEQIHLKSLERHNSPLVGASLLATVGEWKEVAGFKKFCAKPS